MPFVKIAIRQLGKRFQAFVSFPPGLPEKGCAVPNSSLDVVAGCTDIFGTRTKEGFRVGTSGAVGGTNSRPPASKRKAIGWRLRLFPTVRRPAANRT